MHTKEETDVATNHDVGEFDTWVLEMGEETIKETVVSSIGKPADRVLEIRSPIFPLSDA